MTERNSDGWWAVQPRDQWACPECREISPADDWPEREPYCEDCGSHDGRECPRCGEVFDHVLGDDKIEAACAEAGLAPRAKRAP